jgi:hypothetical protein
MTDFFYFYSLIFNLFRIELHNFFKLDASSLITSINKLKSEHSFFFKKNFIILFIFYQVISVA